MISVGTLTSHVTADITGLTVGLNRATAQIKAFSVKTQGFMAANTVAIKGFATAFKGIALVSAAFVGIGIASFAKFDKALRESTAVSTLTFEQFTKMGKMARETALELNIAAHKLARGFYFLGSAGLKANEQIAAFKPTALLAKAGVMEMGEASEILVDVMKGFKIPFTKTLSVVDSLTKGFVTSNQTLYQMGESMKYVSGTMRKMNNDLAETVAVLGFMADVGIKGSMAGTSLRRAMLNLSAPTSAIRKEMHKWGVDIYDIATGKMRPFIEIIADLVDSFKGATEESVNMAMKTIFGVRAISGMLEVVARGGDALRDYAGEIRNAGGTAQEVADKQLAAFSERLGIVFKYLNDIMLTVGEIGINELAGDIGSLTEKVKSLNKELKTGNSVLASYTKGTIAFFKVLGTVISSAFKGLITLFLEIFGIIKMVIGAVTLLINTIYNAMAVLIEVFVTPFQVLWKTAQHTFGKIGEAWELLTQKKFKQAWAVFTEGEFEVISNAADFHLGLIELRVNQLSKTFNKNTKAIKNDFMAMFNAILKLWGFEPILPKVDWSQFTEEINNIVTADWWKELMIPISIDTTRITNEVMQMSERIGREIKIPVEFELKGEELFGAKDAADAAANLQASIDAILTEQEKAIRNFSSAVSQTLYNAFSGSFKKIGDLWKTLLKKMAVQLIMSGLMELIKSLFPGGGFMAKILGFQTGGESPNITGRQFGGLVPAKITGFQHGGLSIPKPQLLTINENGKPEYIVNAEATARNLPLLDSINAGSGIEDSLGIMIEQQSALIEKQNDIIKTLYKTQTRVGDRQISESNERGDRLRHRR